MATKTLSISKKSLPPSYGGFESVARIDLEVPLRALFPREELRSRGGIYFCENLCHKVLPGLQNKQAVKPSKEGDLPAPSTVSLFFWEYNQKRISFEDIERRFPGKEHPVPWWGLKMLLRQLYYAPYSGELPLSMGGTGVLCFIPYRERDEKDETLAAVHSFGKFGTLHPEWWVTLFDKDSKTLCPEKMLFLSAEEV